MEEKKKYILVYEFINDTFKHMIKHVDSANLRGIYIPKGCVRLTLYSKEDYLRSKSQKENWSNFIGFVREKANEVLQDDPEINMGELVQEVQELVFERKQEILRDERVNPIKDIFFGEKYTRSEILNYFGADSYPYQLILNSGSDGLICHVDKYDLYHAIDVFYDGINEFTMGNINHDGYYEGDEEERED